MTSGTYARSIRALLAIVLAIAIAVILFVYDRNPDSVDLQTVCNVEQRGVFGLSCERLALLRAAMITTNDELRSTNTDERLEDFRRTVEYASSPRTPRVICKKTFLGSIYCLRTEEIFVQYSAEAARQIAQDLARALESHEDDVSQFGLIFCPTGTTEVFDLAGLDNTSFAMNSSGERRGRLPTAVSTRLATKSSATTTFEDEVLGSLASDACGGDSDDTPFGTLPIPASQRAFNQCMVNPTSTSPLDPLNQVIEIAADAIACMDAVLAGPSADNDPLAEAREDLASLMNVAGSTAGSSSARWDEYGSASFTAQDENGTWQMTVSTTGEFIIYDPDGTNVEVGELGDDSGAAFADTGPFSGVVADEDGVTVSFDDGSTTTLDSEGNVKKKKGDDEVDEPSLEPVPEDPPPAPEPEGGQCAPDDPACMCGAKADLAQVGLTSCVAGTSACQNIANTFVCCEDVYGMDPLLRPDPDGQFVCEASAAGASEQVQYCAEQCSVFAWDGCMEWCLNGKDTTLPVAGWLDNVCLYVAGLECTYIPMPPMPGGETPSGPVPDGGSGSGGGEAPSGPRPDGLPVIPKDINELLNLSGMFGSPDHTLLEELILRP